MSIINIFLTLELFMYFPNQHCISCMYCIGSTYYFNCLNTSSVVNNVVVSLRAITLAGFLGLTVYN